ncbi:secretin N-terminal domain-containing protein [Prosthecobacter sp.]|uniref:secretin N-terminal domain-containing protein n=1 Tax=Prosthecobacter sp. TaxID=1965333 RepID=UPI00378419C8
MKQHLPLFLLFMVFLGALPFHAAAQSRPPVGIPSPQPNRPGFPPNPVGPPTPGGLANPGTPANPAAPAGPAPAPAAADTTSPASPTDTGKNVITFVATPLAEVIAEYHRVTGRRVLKDRGLENSTVTIDVPGKFSDEEYRIIIEKGLLMHGYALVPSGDNFDKLVATEQGTVPSTQNVPMILRGEDLPATDQVVTFVMELNHLGSEDAKAALQDIIPLHPYGKMLAVPNVHSLIITEASQTIRAYVELAKRIDQPPMETVQKTIKIERAEADEIVEQLGVLLGLGSSGSAPSRRPSAPSGGAVPASIQPSAAGGGASQSSSVGSTSTDSVKPVMQAVARTNSIIVIARPSDMIKIESLVRELDAAPTTNRYFSRKLNYLDLTTFLTIAEKALMRNDLKGQDNSLASQQRNQQTGTNQNTNNQGFNNGSLGSNSLGGGLGSGLNSGLGGLGGSSSGMLGSGSGLGQGFSGSSGSLDLQITKKPLSILIANTLVIADPGSSKFLASGPPDQVKALEELAEELDVRPRQILLSAIIGEFTLTDNFNFGLDWIQSLKQVGNDGLVGGVLNTQGTAFANPSNLKDIAGFLGTGGPAALGGLTAYGQINKNLNVFLQTLESTKRFHVLQKPTLSTLNHQSARIYIGQQVAIAGQSYTSGVVGGGFTSTTQYIPVRLQLDITPHIFNDSEIMLEFRQQKNDIASYTTISGNQVPNISEQGLSNNLIVADRATAMLGGLITERDTNNKSGLPFLVRIPLIKYLVGSTNQAKERREMMIFVQPRILSDADSLLLEQARFGDYSGNFDETAAFAGMPENEVPRPAAVASQKPNDLLPPPIPAAAPAGAPAAEPKKSFFGKMKSIFSRKKTSQP